MGPDGREVAAGPRRDPAAQRRVLERLREVAEGELVLGELLVQRRPQGAGLDSRRARDLVDLEHPIERAQVDRHRARVAVSDAGLDPADDAGPAAVRDRGGAGVGAPLEHRLDLGLVARPGDEVRRMLDLAAKAAHDVAVGLPERVGDALAPIGADDLGQRWRRLEPRRRQLDLLQRHGLLGLAAEPEPLADVGRRRLQVRERGLLVLEPPAPVLARSRGHGGHAIARRSRPIRPDHHWCVSAPCRRYQCTPRIRFANRTCWSDARSPLAAGGCPVSCLRSRFSPFAALESGNR